jgi:hypothetical protein
MNYLLSGHLSKWQKNLNKRKIITKRINYLQICEGVDMPNFSSPEKQQQKLQTQTPLAQQR